MIVWDILEERHVRDLLIFEHTQAASDSLEADPLTGKSMAQEAMGNASLVWLNSSLLLVAQKVAERSAWKVDPTTFSRGRANFGSWVATSNAMAEVCASESGS